MSAVPDRPIALVGLMGAGKSAVARVLGERLAVAVADLDAYIEAEEGCSIAELFEREGEAYFRRREGEVLRQVLDASARVIACGGGVVIDPGHRRLLREVCRVAWLEVTPAEALRRMGTASGRPLLADRASRGARDPEARLATLLAERRALYAEVAHDRIDTTSRTAAQVADAVLAAARAAR